jgi:hypothetical protein
VLNKVGSDQHFYKPNGFSWLVANNNIDLPPLFSAIFELDGFLG